MPKQLTALISFLVWSFWAYSNTITVTSNADSGPGTLREAMTTATTNGITVKDSIVFNLPGSAITDLSIVIGSPLPLSTNLFIDGTSQPGGFFGVSNTKVILKAAALMCYGFYGTDIRDIEIYGIWFKGFQYVPNLTDVCHGEAILLNGICHVIIGAPNKGNAFTNNNGNGIAIFHKNYYGIDFQHANAFADSVTIEHNIFGLNDAADGIVPNATETVFIGNGQNLLINNNSGSAVFSTGSNAVTGNGFLKFTNNNLSDAYNSGGNTTGSLAVSVEGTDGTSAGYDLTIENNKISNASQYCIILWDLTGSIQIRNNELGGYYDLKTVPDDNFCIGMIRCKTTHPVQVINNAITNRKEGIWTAGCGRVFISNNSIWCTNKGLSLQQPVYPIPLTTIRTVTPTTLSGTTSPNASVEIYYTDTCSSLCENGKILEGTVMSDASGIYTFPIAHGGVYSVTATTADSSTSEFNGVKISVAFARVKNATCGQSNGSVTGIQIINATSWHWQDESGNIVGTDTGLLNIGPGKYRMVAYEVNVSCPLITSFFEVLAFAKPVIDPALLSVIQPRCGQPNGKIKSAATKPPGSVFRWYNQAGDFVQDWGDSALNLSPGTYFCKLYLWEDSTCYSIYGPYNLVNQSGPLLNTGTVQIAPSTCNQNNGSITGFSVTNLTAPGIAIWVDSLNNVVGNNYSLVNIPAGKYRFKFKDASGCDTIITNYFIVPGVGAINVDSAGETVKASNCSGPTGSIYGIKATGASQYQWTDVANNNTIGNAIDAFKLSSGRYQLTMSNSYGCSLTLPPVFVPQSVFTTIGVTGVSFLPDLCFQNNGHVKIMSFNNDSTLFQFRWVDSATQQVAGRGTELNNAKAGTYYLWAKDTNQCEKMIFTDVIIGTPFPVMNTASIQVKDDHCELKQGSVSSLQVTGLYGPTTYTWYNENNQAVGNTIDLKNAGAGSYTLKVVDAGVCTVQSPPVIIKNITDAVEPPRYNDLVIPRYSDAVLTPVNMTTGTYYLVGAPGSQQQNNSGSFTIKNVSSDTAVNIVKQYGTCTSATVTVNIKVVDKSWFAIPTAFTPNGDGRNDWLHVKIIGYIQLSYFRVYNRWGQLVFETHKLNAGWNGMYGGQLQDTGTYIWLAEGKDIKGNTVTGRGSFVLIR